MSMREILERHGHAYGRLHLAVNFTDGITGEAAKQNTKGWKRTIRLPHAAAGVAILQSRGLAYNPIVCLRASGMIGVDIDGPQGRRLAHAYQFPTTVRVKTGNGEHLWYWSPETAPATVAKVQFADKVTVSSDGYLVAPPARHPDGHTYAFVAGCEPWTIAIAVLPSEIVEQLAHEGRATQTRLRTSNGAVTAGYRHEHLRQISWAMRRYSGASQEAIEAALITENEHRCQPPKPEHLVRELAEYTYLHVQPIGGDDA